MKIPITGITVSEAELDELLQESKVHDKTGEPDSALVQRLQELFNHAAEPDRVLVYDHAGKRYVSNDVAQDLFINACQEHCSIGVACHLSYLTH